VGGAEQEDPLRHDGGQERCAQRQAGQDDGPDRGKAGPHVAGAAAQPFSNDKQENCHQFQHGRRDQPPWMHLCLHAHVGQQAQQCGGLSHRVAQSEHEGKGQDQYAQYVTQQVHQPADQR